MFPFSKQTVFLKETRAPSNCTDIPCCFKMSPEEGGEEDSTPYPACSEAKRRQGRGQSSQRRHRNGDQSHSGRSAKPSLFGSQLSRVSSPSPSLLELVRVMKTAQRRCCCHCLIGSGGEGERLLTCSIRSCKRLPCSGRP